MLIIRKELNFTWDEWEALPWWQQRAYSDALTRYNQEQAYEQWVQGGRRGPQPDIDFIPDKDMEEMPDIEDVEGLELIAG